LFALAVIKSESVPDETPVICQVAVLVPLGKLPTLKLGALTEKWPFCELSVTVALDKVVYCGVFTVFSIATDTVLVSPTFIVVGIWFVLFPSSTSRY
jgi:hypothetical protein